jgi:hypothetical protein
VAALAVPAGAAVPKTPASQTLPCNDGSGKSAQVWVGHTTLAAKNPCRTQWLTLGFGGLFGNLEPELALQVVPGAHFSWDKRQTAQYSESKPYDGPAVLASCGWGEGPGFVKWIHSYKDVTDPGPDAC